MDFFDQLFDQLDTAESYAILAILLGAFLLGLLVGMLLRAAGVRRLRGEQDKLRALLAAREAEIATVLGQLTTANDRKVTIEAEADALRSDLDTAHARLARLEQEKSRLYNDVHAINDELERLQSTNQSYLATIEDLNTQLNGLRSRGEPFAASGRPVARSAEPTPVVALNERLEALEQKMLQLESENISLKQEVDELKTGAPARDQILEGSSAYAQTGEPYARQRDLSPQADLRIGEAEKDDLTLIRGIGPFIEKQLNSIGVYTYEQMMRWDEDDIDDVTNRLQYFEGRIAKDDWAGQARRLHELKTQDPEAFSRLVENLHDPADLKIIEGVGEDIEKLLKSGGINTWEDLANTSVDRLHALLDNAGYDRDATSWPVQARLAVNGDWDLLEEYQEQLIGGRR
jgi:predicted flap endonuclease-1-like 5' DNA nuclease